MPKCFITNAPDCRCGINVEGPELWPANYSGQADTAEPDGCAETPLIASSLRLASNADADPEDGPLVAPTLNFERRSTGRSRRESTPDRKADSASVDEEPLVAPTLNFERA